jgi:hypothetical protein
MLSKKIKSAYPKQSCYCTFSDSCNYPDGEHWFGQVVSGSQHIRVRWTRCRRPGKTGQWEKIEQAKDEPFCTTLPNDSIMIYFLQFGDVHTYPSQIFSRHQSLHKKHQESPR